MVKYLSLKLHCSGPITESPAMITLNGVEQLVKKGKMQELDSTS